jgi:MerR family transcriptional regulator, repressor of the yfmOP operon
MEVITIDSIAFKQIIEKMDLLEARFENLAEASVNPLKDKWLDIEEVCFLLKVSKRTLQSYRNDKLLPYSIIGKKVYYRASDVEKFLLKNYRKVKGY